MELTYTRHGDYLLPDIKLSDPPYARPLGKYGMMHKAYLKNHKPALALYGRLLLSERLYPLMPRNRRSRRNPPANNPRPGSSA